MPDQISREESFPPSAAKLVLMLETCCRDQTMNDVLMASSNLLSHAINKSFEALKLTGNITDAEYPKYLGYILHQCGNIAIENHRRAPQPTDIPVKPD